MRVRPRSLTAWDWLSERKRNMSFLEWKYRPKSKDMSPDAKDATEVEETPEGFASRNAKTITFLVTLAVLLLLIGPISVFTIYRQLTGIREYDGEVMTEEDIILLGNLGVDFRASYLRGYERSESKSDGRRTYIVKTEKYILNVVENEETGEVIVSLLTDKDSGDCIDIRVSDVEEFLASH